MFKKKEQNGFFGQFNQSDLSIDLFKKVLRNNRNPVLDIIFLKKNRPKKRCEPKFVSKPQFCRQ